MTVQESQMVPNLARWLLPSLKDLLFLLFLFILMTPTNSNVLSDADTGWHIRNGEHLLQTRNWVYTDVFSYSHLGGRWYAWEWLADLTMALIHQFTGLNGIVIWANLTIALTFTWLFGWLVQRGADVFFSLTFTLIGGFAASLHWLARPHLFTLLFTLILYMQLEGIQARGTGKRLWMLPALFVVWVNLHPGFVVGLVLLAIYGIGNLLTIKIWRDAQIQVENKKRARLFFMLFIVCILASLINPYGASLYGHIGSSFLHSSFLADHINEWASPDFHTTVTKAYEFLLLSSIVVMGISFRRVTLVEVGLLVFFSHLSLYSRRNVPLYVVIVVPVVLGHFTSFLSSIDELRSPKLSLSSALHSYKAFSKRISSFESQFKGILFPTIAACTLIITCLNHGYLGDTRVLDAGFNQNQFPVKAAQFIEQAKPTGNLFTTDSWGGYIIYRFYPEYKVFLDGRFDMYGQPLIEDYLKIRDLNYDCREVLNKYKIKWILLPVDYGLATALKELNEWEVIYDDHQAIIFSRRNSRF